MASPRTPNVSPSLHTISVCAAEQLQCPLRARPWQVLSAHVCLSIYPSLSPTISHGLSVCLSVCFSLPLSLSVLLRWQVLARLHCLPRSTCSQRLTLFTPAAIAVVIVVVVVVLVVVVVVVVVCQQYSIFVYHNVVRRSAHRSEQTVILINSLKHLVRTTVAESHN